MYYDCNGKQITKNCNIEIGENKIYKVHESPYNNLYIVDNNKYYYLNKDVDVLNIKVV